MVEQPSGTVTLVFTDIEGSTRLLRELGVEGYREALSDHRSVVRGSFERYGGYEVDYEGDAFFFAFSSASDAFGAVEEAMRGLEAGPVRLRVGIHSGEPGLDPPKYVGLDVHRAARIMSVGYGGQVLVSESTRMLVPDARLRDLGEHRLKDLAGPERLWQLGAGEFPPLRSLHRTNLPLAAGPLLGREEELARIRQLVVDQGVRLLTLTGPGGSGKTRLALQAAAELAEEFPDGVYFVALAPLSESEAVAGAVAQALELSPDDDVRTVLGSGRRLLVLDNAEHLDGLERVVSELLLGETRMLVTSRALLHIQAEHVLNVEPLAEEPAAELFVLRASAAGRSLVPDATVAALCRRLDNLPLAIELAAARSKLLSPQAILDRLEQALPLLTGGPRDAPERQQTLRATLKWSHDLLDEPEQVALRQLAVFRGGIPIEGAVEVAGADLDLLGSLVDKSLLKSVGDDRFLVLETVREYALEQLEAAGEAQELSLRHARWYLEQVAAIEQDSMAEAVMSWYLVEVDNLRAALATLEAAGAADAALLLASTMWRVWRGAQRNERQVVLERLLAGGGGSVKSRAWAMESLASALRAGGEIDRARGLHEQAVALADEADDDEVACQALFGIAWIARMKGHFQEAFDYAEQARGRARAAGKPGFEALADRAEGVAAAESGDYARERAAYERELRYRQSTGDTSRVADTMGNLGILSTLEGDPETAVWYLEQALEVYRAVSSPNESTVLASLGYAALAMADTPTAREYFAQCLEVALLAGDREAVTLGLDGLAAMVAKDKPCEAVEMFAAAAAVREAMGIPPDPMWADLATAGLAEARAGCGAGFDTRWTRGRTTAVDTVVALAVRLARDFADGSAREDPLES